MDAIVTGKNQGTPKVGGATGKVYGPAGRNLKKAVSVIGK
jgi:hypothetical protein